MRQTGPMSSTVARRSPAHPGMEIALVLGLSLGKSAVYAVLSLADKLTQPKKLSEQTTVLNGDFTPERPWLDLAYQVAGVVFPVVPALLAIYLLSLAPGSALRTIGLDRRRPGRDILAALGIAAGIGIPGLGLYLGARALGLNTAIAAGAISAHWWTVPVYVLQAAENGVLEEVVMIGYLLTRLREVRWPWWGAIAFSAVLRGSYHLYQGFGGFVGNAIMGALFGAYFARTRRVLPLVLAHTVIDVVAYVGYAYGAAHLSWLR